MQELFSVLIKTSWRTSALIPQCLLPPNQQTLTLLLFIVLCSSGDHRSHWAIRYILALSLNFLRWHWSCRHPPLDQPVRYFRLLTLLKISLFSKTTVGVGSTLSRSWDPFLALKPKEYYWGPSFDHLIQLLFISSIQSNSKVHFTAQWSNESEINLKSEYKIPWRIKRG